LLLSLVVSLQRLAPAGSLPPAVEAALKRGYQSNDPQVLAQAAELAEQQLQADPQNDELHRALGILYLDRLGAPAKALPHLEKTVASAPNDAGWQQALARALRIQGRVGEAAEHYREAAALRPGDSWTRYELGNTLSAAGSYSEAIGAYRSAIELDPKNTDMHLALAKTLWAAQQTDDAAREARTVLDLEPFNAEARRLLSMPSSPTPPPVAPVPPPIPTKSVSPVDTAVAKAYTSGRADDFRRAARLLEEDLRREPKQLARRKSLGYLYLEKLKDPAAAVPHLEKVCEATPRDGAWLQMLAKAQVAAGQREAAVATWQRAAKVAPRDLWARYHLGCTLRDLHRNAEAEAAFREALALDSRNTYVRHELARLAYNAGRKNEARDYAQALLHEDPNDAEAHAVLGDVYRSSRDFTAAGLEYQAALATSPAHPLATAGIREIRKAQRPEAKLAFYTFEDTDGLTQTGVFSQISVLLTGRLRVSAILNERFFQRDFVETIERYEGGLGLDYRFSDALLLSTGVSQFKTQNLDRETGGNFAIYFSPIPAFDTWVSYRLADPVNDSYITARDAFTQNILAAGLNLRPTRSISAGFTASTSNYSDGNTRRSALASLAWRVPLPTSPVVRLEYEWLDFEDRTSAYSSPQSYARVRPVLEFTPRITDWLKLEFHGELSYVFDEHEWGTGFTVGPRFTAGDRFDLGASYMKYEIPGGQTTWSGQGFKVDLSARF
jgi:tetratricopeptide (TPR) repeat protein